MKNNLKKHENRMYILDKILLIASFLVVVAIVGFWTANRYGRTYDLTNEEVNHYVQTANKAWKSGLVSVENDHTVSIEYSLTKKTVKVSHAENQNNYQSVTVDFSSNPAKVTINNPEISYIATFLFYGLIVGFIVFLILVFIILTVKMKISDLLEKKHMQKEQEI